MDLWGLAHSLAKVSRIPKQDYLESGVPWGRRYRQQSQLFFSNKFFCADNILFMVTLIISQLTTKNFNSVTFNWPIVPSLCEQIDIDKIIIIS